MVIIVDQAASDNSYATGSVNGSTNVGGLIGYDSGGNTLTNNWWYNAVNSVGVGNSSPSGVTEASSANDFYGTGGGTGAAVYSTWDFNGLWASQVSANPTLMWQGMGDGSAFIGGTALHPFQISNVNQLQFMEYDLSGYFALANNIDASATSEAGTPAKASCPLAIVPLSFTGTLEGNSKVLDSLYINMPGTNDIGLFGYTNDATIQNVGLTNMDITGQSNVGGLVGKSKSSTIDNSYANGSVAGNLNVGGLVGLNSMSSTISNSYATGTVTGASQAGGLVGYNSTGSTIDNSYASSTVNGSGGYIGGLAGANWSSSIISNSYASGSVAGANYVGGLVGANGDSIIDNSYASGSVMGSSWGVGGLVGENWLYATITNSYATGTVTGASNAVGGLVGYNGISSVIDNSYATGSVTGQSQVGGLVGWNYSHSTIDNSYATGVATSSSDTAGGLIGYDDGTNTLTNNWWYNATNIVGVGNSSVLGVNEAGAASDFFNTSQAVYNGVTPWDFSTIWLATGSYPVFSRNYDIWSGSGDWSLATNWSRDAVPTATTNVAFTGLSTNDSTIDAGFGGDIASLVIFPNYTGTITQDTNLNISGDYLQSAGSFVSNPAKSLSVGNSFTLAGGTFTGSTGTITDSGAFTQSGGTFTAPSGTFNVGGNWNMIGGEFDPGTLYRNA